jgi:hypothetical protein
MRKILLLVLCLSLLLVTPNFTNAKNIFKGDGENLFVRNDTEYVIDFWIHVHAWGCGGLVQQFEDLDLDFGVDLGYGSERCKDCNTQIDNRWYKDSFFEKMAQHKHFTLPPNKWVKVWTWPSAKCLMNNGKVDFSWHWHTYFDDNERQKMLDKIESFKTKIEE